MEFIFVLGALMLIGLVLLAANGGRSALAPKVEAKALLTDRERKAMAALEAALPQHRIYPQVAMGALIRTKKSLSKKEQPGVRNTFSQKIIDFVAEDRHSGELLLIEVDDKTHKADKDKKRDALTAEAGYRTVRIPAGADLNPATIRALVFPLGDGADQAAAFSAPAPRGNGRRRVPA